MPAQEKNVPPKRAKLFLLVLLCPILLVGWSFYPLLLNPADAIQKIGPQSEPATLSSCSNLANWECAETRAGLSLCRANNICVVKVDLNNTSLRPRVVVPSGGGTAWLSSMAGGAGALAAINGDYFSGCPDTVPPLNCGEGLTFVDGTDYTDYTGSEWQIRRSLGFNNGYDPNIGWPGEQDGYHRYLLGGGPQITFGGEYRWRCWYQQSNTEGDCACQDNTVVINEELFGCSASNWWNRPQTVVGFSDDRNTLFMAVSEPGFNKTPHEMHDVLWVMGSRYALKQDGGGSSGMYFNDGSYQFAWDGGREVANAWVVVPNTSPPPTATPIPGGCNPGADQVALFVDPDYNGQCVVKGVGEYPNPSSIGLPNDAISSLKVGGSVQAVLCLDDNYGGGCETFLGDDSNLGDNSIGDNQVSSARVEWRTCTPDANQVALYANPDYAGNCITLGIGEYPNPGYLGPVGNDNAESIRVGSNVQAILCVDDNYQGTCETLAADDANLGDNAVGANSVSSARVEQPAQQYPDLQPYAPSGYPAPIVAAAIQGTYSDGTLYAGKPAYFDWHFANTGEATAAGSFFVELWVDGVRYSRYPYADFAAGATGGFNDWREIIDTPGWHTVRLVVDPDNTIAEADETNNSWEQQLYWQEVTGWWGEYFNNETVMDPAALVRDDAQIDFDWAYGSPGAEINDDSFSARWTRDIYYSAGMYEFSLTHDDGVRMWIDEELVLDQWGTCCRTEIVQVDLSAGLHSLRIEMFDHAGAAVARMEWQQVEGEWSAYLPIVWNGR